jgi:hypothetical protein
MPKKTLLQIIMHHRQNPLDFIHPFYSSILSKYSRIKILWSSITFRKRESKDHLVAAKEEIFLFRYSVLLAECDVKVAIPFKKKKKYAAFFHIVKVQ